MSPTPSRRDLVQLAARLRPGGRAALPSLATRLPDDLMRDACRRVRIAALVTAALWAFVLLMNDVLYSFVQSSSDETWRPAWEGIGTPVAIVGLALSLVMAWIARRFVAQPQRVLDLGLVFEVATALCISLIQWWHPVMHGARVSWVGVLILTYPSIAPNTLRATLVASLAAASTELVGFAIASARGVVPAEATPFVLAWTFAGPYICALLAIIPVRVIRGLGRQVAAARELGSYRIERLLGRGGMGEVHLASHRMLARPAAIKVIRPEMLGTATPEGALEVATRFRREADAAASLRSPHTIQLYDFGVADDGNLFCVMELLDGLDLDTLVRRHGPVPLERAVHLVAQACESLAEAHARGLVHRDVKPSNLFTCRLGLEVDFLKVLDFGLVRQEGGETEAGGVAHGTPAYMAPEAVLDPSSVDRRADLYALGCVLYWLVTGRRVFEGPTTTDVLLLHAHAEPQPPSRATAQPLPPELDAVVLACLAKDRQARPNDASELAARLQRVPLADAWTPERAQRWWQAHAPPQSARAPDAKPIEGTATILHPTR